jgi:hypothetical protein
MSMRTEWERGNVGFTFLASDEEHEDGMTPDTDEATTGNVALAIGGVVIYGQPAELLELLADGVSKVSAHLAGQQ